MNQHDTDELLKTAVDAYRPSTRIFERVRTRIRREHGGVKVLFVSADSAKILEKVFKKYDAWMQKIA